MPTVLIADDSAVVRLTLSSRLRASGVTVIEAGSMSAALRVDITAIDAALLDIDLGDGDGVTVAEALRAQRADLPLAFFSSETNEPIFSRAASLATIFSKGAVSEAVAWALTATSR
ncbi:MAG: response regulator, partial [Polyangiaceae bacterium]